MSLIAWSEGRPEWQRDALRRITQNGVLTDQDQASIRLRLKHAHGIAVEGDVACSPLAEAHLPPGAEEVAPTLLCGIGPVTNVDRLTPEQQLRFGLSGITLVFGDNGTGKSGYARIAKKLCRARVIDDLRGNVFNEQTSPPAAVHFRFWLPEADEPEDADWADGDVAPTMLGRIMVLDEASARVYIDGQNEITYLPREIEIAAHLGATCTAISADIEREIEEIGLRCRTPITGYDPQTAAGRLVTKLTPERGLNNLPQEEQLRDTAAWSPEKEVELGELKKALANNPTAQAAIRRRVIALLGPLAEEIHAAAEGLSGEMLALAQTRIADAAVAAAAAAQAAEIQFTDEPLQGTGQGTWQRLFAIARQFAAEARVRGIEEAFQPGDPCPVCQRDLDDATAVRFNRFDDFVRGAAATASANAQAALEAVVGGFRGVEVSNTANIERSLAEFRSLGENQANTAWMTIEYLGAAAARRDAIIAGLIAGHIPPLGVLPISPAANIRAEIERLANEATALEVLPSDDEQRVSRIAELSDVKRLAEGLNDVLTRCADLRLRQRLTNCRSSLDTRAISMFVTRRRRELITPELRDGIINELTKLDLSHVPFRFEEASDRGRNFFDVVLDTRQQAIKARVLSEGEQRALGIACFFAEMGRIRGKHAIIVDDPVSSLDQQRLQKVARRLVEEAAAGRQVIVFTHHLVFYQEILSAAAAADPQVPTIVNLISKSNGQFGVISENDEPWIAKKVTRRIEFLRKRFNAVTANVDRSTDEYRRMAKDFYTDLRESWERLVEEILLGGVVERFSSGVKTQSLKEVVVEDDDYRTIYAAMKRVSEFSGHDMAAGRQLPVPDVDDMRRDLDAIDSFRLVVHRRKAALRERRLALEQPPVARLV